MAVVISDAVLKKVHMTGEDLLTDLACYLYDKSRLSFGKASELSGLNYLQFQKALAERSIDIKYAEEDLNIDLKNLGIKI
ncbi:putative HTH domain antitoxin [Neolewinella xylanilytica]|uniref:Putative HTH domain antitoxin n=1 Tax=Neolewinella xylanilytica TaxID=1514080 RepID=A0A2S6I6I2_9BACT|nr:putative HTH domain antitoxin [Neolewinella xylanilytica]